MADEYIRKADAKDALQEKVFHNLTDEFYGAMQVIDELEPADVVPIEPQEIGYGQCANAMLKMWMDNVVTDVEYNRIVDRLNKLYFSGGEKKE